MRVFHQLFAMAGLLSILFFGLTYPANAQPRFIPLNVDYAVFKNADNSPYVEVYISIRQNAISYTTADSGYVANFSAILDIRDGEGTRQFAQEQPFLSRITDQQVITPANELRHVFQAELATGNYEATATIRDNNTGAKGEYLLEIKVSDPDSTTVQLSDIQLAAGISKSAGAGKFIKNGLQVVPNPSGVFHPAHPVLYYYLEAYQMAYDADKTGSYTVRAEIEDNAGEVVKSFPDKTSNKPGSSAVIVGGGNIITLPSGPHFLNIRFTDNESGETLLRRKRFSVYKPSQEQADRMSEMVTSLMASHYAKFTEEELDEEFAQLTYLASKTEKDVFKSLSTVESKVNFLVTFWQERDENRDTPANEFKIQYFQNLKYANAAFKTKRKAGWKTDRGRVFLIYGQPSDIERNPVGGTERPYEVWTYNALAGGSIFVFADLRGFGDYELLHSTYRNELSQPNWREQVGIENNLSQ